MKRIYLDNSATTPVDKKVLDAMLPYFSQKFGNSSSIHDFGQTALSGVDQAREQAASFLHCEPLEIIFTSGATEANNLAIKGVIKKLQEKNKNTLHVITSKVEHEAILEPCHDLERSGVEVTYLNVDSRGAVNVNELTKAIKNNTVLVSIMYVNSEVGTIMPIRAIGKAIRKINEQREKIWSQNRTKDRGEKPQPIYFHTDATQAVNFLNCDVAWNYIDLLSLSGHKIYGPKGVGLLYKKTGVPITAIQHGGHQEKNLRSGTLNVPGIVGLGAALAQLTQKNIDSNNKKIAKLRDQLVVGILKNIPNTVLNTDRTNSTPAHAHFSFLGVEGESMLIGLDLAGVAVSTGSACASGSLEPSYVLLAMGIKAEVAHNSIRFTLGKYNTADEIKRVIKVLPPIIARLRKMAPEL